MPPAWIADNAALVEPIAVGVHAVAFARTTPDDVALVIGCGPIGLAVIAALKLQAHRPVIAADFSPARRALARRMGADIVVDPAATSPYRRSRRRHPGRVTMPAAMPSCSASRRSGGPR